MKKSASSSLGNYNLDSDRCDPYTNASLTITLRIGFRQVNPQNGKSSGVYNDYGDSTKSPHKIVAWSQSYWLTWIKAFVRSAQSYWDGRIWLTNNFTELEFEAKGVKYRPNIDCRLSIHGEPVRQVMYHHVIDVVKLDQSEQWFGSHSTLYDNLDTRAVSKGTDRAGKPIMQVAHVHEIGHLLGLRHVDEGKPHCLVSGNTNAQQCYGVSDSDKRSVMGGGIALRAEHAIPWRRAAIQLIGRGNLSNTTDWPATRLRVFPRTLAEAAANKTITQRPIR